METHDYVPRADGFRTEAVIDDERKSGIPCQVCAQFKWNHEAPKVVTDAGKRTTSKPKSTAKKSTAKKTTARKAKSK